MAKAKSRPAEWDLDEVIAHFSDLQDPRSEINRKHPLISVVVTALLAVLAGATGPTMIAQWAAIKADFLASVLPMPHGVPGKDVFRRVLMALRPDTFQRCFDAWIQTLRQDAEARTGVHQPTLAIDGKTLRRSHDRSKGLGALHLVSVWASEYGLSLGQVACKAKSNEITAIGEILEDLDVAGAIVTIDAIGCQKGIAESIVAGGGDYVLALKKNQKTLYREVFDHVVERGNNDFAGGGVGRLQLDETGHGRNESRTVLQLEAPDHLRRWPGLKSIGVVITQNVREGREVDEVRYFLSSLEVEAVPKRLAHAVRSHWGIENGCHWSLDVTYGEDQSRIRQGHLRENMAWLSRFTLSLLKQHPGRQSLVAKRRSCGWSETFLMQVIATSAS